jgi:methylglyoxal synthase
MSQVRPARGIRGKEALMEQDESARRQRKKIALVAHDNKKRDLLEWSKYNRDLLVQHELCATGTTGKLLEEELDFEVVKLKSGPLGGDQQIGAKITEGEIDLLIFFWDPLEPQPHDPDVKALLRIAVVWNIPVACNRASADFMVSSPLMSGEYERFLPDYEDHKHRLKAAYVD